MREQIIKLLNADLIKGISIYKLAKDIGIQYSTLYRLVKKQSDGNITTWEKIEKYYQSHEKILPDS